MNLKNFYNNISRGIARLSGEPPITATALLDLSHFRGTVRQAHRIAMNKTLLFTAV